MTTESPGEGQVDIKKVDSSEQIPRSEGFMVYNPGHTEAIEQVAGSKLDPFAEKFESPENRQYSLSLDMNQLALSPVVHDKKLLRSLVLNSARQLRVDSTRAVGYLQMHRVVPENEEYPQKYRDAREIYLMNMRTVQAFVTSSTENGAEISGRSMKALEKAYRAASDMEEI